MKDKGNLDRKEADYRRNGSRGVEGCGKECGESREREWGRKPDGGIDRSSRGNGGPGPGREPVEWIGVLREAFEVPAPLRKQAFLRDIRHRRVSTRQFILRQAAYIRKWVWIVSLMVFLAAFLGGHILERDVLWMLSAMMPLLAASAVAEYARSEVYGMAELEMSARFGLKAVVLARMGVLGTVHFGTLCLVSLFGGGEGSGVFRTGIWLLAPYLATDAATLWIVRRLRGREGLYACLGLAVVVGAIPVFLRYAKGLAVWQAEDFGRCLAATALLGALAAVQWKKSIERTEELTWNL